MTAITDKIQQFLSFSAIRKFGEYYRLLPFWLNFSFKVICNDKLVKLLITF